MTVAVVFDSAGTLMRTYRVARNVIHHDLLLDIETTILTFDSPDRVLIVLHVHSRDIMAADPDNILSDYLVTYDIGFGIACSRRIITAEEIGDILYSDRTTRVRDLQVCIRSVWDKCKKEAIVVMDSGAILNIGLRNIEYVVTSGGRPFHGARQTITQLHKHGIATFIASGDRSAKLEKIADHLGIQRDHVYGVATPAVKAQIVEDLKHEYDTVIMVGDGINDLAAFSKADVSILSEQQKADRPSELYKRVDYVIKNVHQVVDIAADILAQK